MPVAREFNPNIVLVSCGFDASAGHPHPIGGYLVSTACFAYMTKQVNTGMDQNISWRCGAAILAQFIKHLSMSFHFQLRELADGKVVLVLEGGFNLDVLTEASEQCARALLGLPIEKVCLPWAHLDRVQE